MAATVTDLFCGAGGSSLGAEAAGAELVMAANHWATAIEVHQAHFPNAGHDCADISQADPRRYPRTDILLASRQNEALVGELFMANVDIDTVRVVAEMAKMVAFGSSSSAMIRFAITGATIDSYPSDWDDLERCEIAHAVAPEWLAERMTSTLISFRLAVYRLTRGERKPPADMVWSPHLKMEYQWA